MIIFILEMMTEDKQKSLISFCVLLTISISLYAIARNDYWFQVTDCPTLH